MNFNDIKAKIEAFGQKIAGAADSAENAFAADLHQLALEIHTEFAGFAETIEARVRELETLSANIAREIASIKAGASSHLTAFEKHVTGDFSALARKVGNAQPVAVLTGPAPAATPAPGSLLTVAQREAAAEAVAQAQPAIDAQTAAPAPAPAPAPDATTTDTTATGNGATPTPAAAGNAQS
jgi:hypothetical protein